MSTSQDLFDQAQLAEAAYATFNKWGQSQLNALARLFKKYVAPTPKPHAL